MTKVLVKAMDAVQQFAASLDNVPRIRSFVLSGISKYGWACWLAAAVDNRVEAIIPIVIPVLNMSRVFYELYQSLGVWTYVMEPHVSINFYLCGFLIGSNIIFNLFLGDRRCLELS
jgi:PhoPQ-activated pathogenicity-related protein